MSGSTNTPDIIGSGRWVAITPSNTVDLPDGYTRAIYVGGAGNMVADSANGETSVTFTGLLAGMIYPLRVKRVRATSTTATLLIALY